jgi:hypothetical protein
MNEVRHRIILSIIIVLTFAFIVKGILVSMHINTSIEDEWKELLLLLLGALIGNFGKVVDYWFNPKNNLDNKE